MKFYLHCKLPNFKRVSNTSAIIFRKNQLKICLCCTLRSGLHVIPTMVRTFPCGLENIHASKWISDNTYVSIPGKLSDFHLYLLLLSIPGDKVLKVSNIWDKSVLYISEENRPFSMDLRTTMQANGFLTTFQECWQTCYSWKIIRYPFACMVVLESMRKGLNHCWNFI